MPTDEQHIDYSAEDLLRYARGNMPVQERHALEKAALEDIFLSEALDGYMSQVNELLEVEPLGNLPSANGGIPELEKLRKIIADKAADKKEERKATLVSILRNRWLQTAVAALFIFGGAWWLYSISNKPKESVIASNINLAKDEKKADVPPPPMFDSAVANTSKPLPPTVVDNVAVRKNKLETTQDQASEDRNVADKPSVSASKQTLHMDTVSQSKDLANVDKAAVPQAAPGALSKAKSENNLNEVVVTGYGTQKKMANGFSNANVIKTPSYTFQGRILDANNNPLPYSSVMVPGENFGTYSDGRGYFNFIYTDSVLPVRAKSLGFEPQNFNLYSKAKENRIVLNEDKNLDKNMAFFKQTKHKRAADYKPTIMQVDSIATFAEPNIGWNSYDLYLTNNNRISDLPMNNRAVQLSFEVDKNGEAKNITIEKSQGKDLDAEAVRLVKEGPKWKAKTGDGKGKVVVKF